MYHRLIGYLTWHDIVPDGSQPSTQALPLYMIHFSGYEVGRFVDSFLLSFFY